MDQVHEQFDAALGDIAQALDVDGYSLQITNVVDGRLELEIIARPDACRDCLVPKSMMLSMIQPLVEDRGISSIEIRYPND